MSKILLIGGRPYERILYRWELGDAGYSVWMASNKKDVLRHLALNRPDVIVVNPDGVDATPSELIASLGGAALDIPLIVHSDTRVTGVGRPCAHVPMSSDLGPLKVEIAQVLNACPEERAGTVEG